MSPEFGRPGRRPRVGLAAEVTLGRPEKSRYRVRVFDLSADGCELEFIEPPDLGKALWLKFEGMESLEARVRWTVGWTGGFTAGVEFQRPLSPAVVELLVRKLANGA